MSINVYEWQFRKEILYSPELHKLLKEGWEPFQVLILGIEVSVFVKRKVLKVKEKKCV